MKKQIEKPFIFWLIESYLPLPDVDKEDGPVVSERQALMILAALAAGIIGFEFAFGHFD